MISKIITEICDRGVQYSDSGKALMAIAEFSKVIELAPDWALPYFWRANEYEELSEFEKSYADFSKYIELANANKDELLAEAYAGRGYALRRLGRPDEAVADYSMELELNPGSAQGYLDRSLAYDAMGEDDRAAEDYEKAINLDPTVTDGCVGRPKKFRNSEQDT